MNAIAVKQPRHDAAMWLDGVEDKVSSLPHPLVTTYCEMSLDYFYAPKPSGGVVAHAIISGVSESNMRFGVIYRQDNPLLVLSWRQGVTNSHWSRLITLSILIYTWNHIIVRYWFDTSTADLIINDTQYLGLSMSSVAYIEPGASWIVGGREASLYAHGCIRNIMISNGSDITTIAGNGIESSNWAGGVIAGSPERCLVHVRGAVIRTDGNNNRYIVT